MLRDEILEARRGFYKKMDLEILGRKVETVYRKDNGEAKPKIGENTERGVEMEKD